MNLVAARSNQPNQEDSSNMVASKQTTKNIIEV